MEGWATFSPDRRYRWDLGRIWDSSKTIGAFVCLNPSKAGEKADDNDNTVRKMIGFAQRWGWGGFALWNMFGFIATHPADLWTAADPIGMHGNQVLAARAAMGGRPVTGPIVAGWGAFTHPKARARVKDVLAGPLAGVPLLSIGPPTRDGHPAHPLMLTYALELRPWPTMTTP